ncbi:MAG: restriction endonuclease [Thermoproteota archaeon]
MNRRYLSGYRFEQRVRKLFEKNGFTVFRSAGSKQIDLIAVKCGHVFLIECRKDEACFSRNDLGKLRRLAERTGLRVILASRKNRKVFLLGLEDGKKIPVESLSCIHEKQFSKTFQE